MSVILDAPVELRANSSSEEINTVIRDVYKQVLSNPHIMESERLVTQESQLCNGEISVRDFVRLNILSLVQK
ncbi:phycobilisome linker polypeptide [Calothrix sp. NIES-4101]|nr:phycobilisome linker polypeptide [Calothrix sp. NIES-4101]